MPVLQQFSMPASVASTPSAVEREPSDGDEARETRIASAVRRIRDEQLRLATGPVCHDVCYATATMCTAAGELCRLTGVEDARCVRAREACDDAGRQRDGTCPSCPPSP